MLLYVCNKKSYEFLKGGFDMISESKVMLTADDVAELLDVKRSRAYSIIRQLNAELKAQGKLVLRGRVNRQYFESKINI